MHKIEFYSMVLEYNNNIIPVGYLLNNISYFVDMVIMDEM
jgi:hypothetical protein